MLMLEWMIVIGAICGAIAMFGLIVILLDGIWQLRVATRLERLLPRARARIRLPKQRSRCT